MNIILVLMFFCLINAKSSYVRTRGFVLCCAQARWDTQGKLQSVKIVSKDLISACGTNCIACYCFEKMCNDCNSCEGKVFHTSEGANPMLPVIILDDRVALQAMVEEMYQELPERKPKKKKA